MVTTSSLALRRLLPVLEHAARSCRLLEGVTPTNWADELARLTGARHQGQRVPPQFVFPEPACHLSTCIATLDSLARAFESLSDTRAPQLALRAHELAHEARLLQSIGSDEFLPLARQRYPAIPAADHLAATWANLPLPPQEGPSESTVASDDEQSPGSLVNQLRRAVATLRVPVRVVIRTNLAPLAATGYGVVYVASGRQLTHQAIARTVRHEIEGHVMPWQRRPQTPWPLALRPPGDTDAEEGRALRLEETGGFLDTTRRKELGLRHVAACLAHDGLEFHAIADALEHRGARVEQATYLTARALRGGGLGRERVYLNEFLHVSPQPIGQGAST